MREALTRNTGDTREQGRLRAEEELHHFSVLEGLAFLLQHKTCREWLWDVLCRMKHYDLSTSLDHPNVDALSHYHAGERHAADIIERDCKRADLGAYVLMMKEGLELDQILEGQQQPREQARKKQRGGNRGRRKIEELVRTE